MQVVELKLCGMQLPDALLSHCGYFYYTRMGHGKLSGWPSFTGECSLLLGCDETAMDKELPHACLHKAVDPCSWQLSS
jgi:hypothetical protein